VAGITGTPADSANSRASILFPNRRITSGGGPMKTIPSFSQASASSGFSARNP
jgi:hypothetical protein